MARTLAIRPKRAIAGSATLTGTISCSSSLLVERFGVIPPGVILQSTSGGITPSGTVATLVSGPSIVTVPKAVAGSITPTGALTTFVDPTTIDPSGVEAVGLITPHGALATLVSGPSFVTIPLLLVGQLTPAGALSTAVSGDGGLSTQAVSGTITPHGAVVGAVSGPSFVTVPKSVFGTLTPHGALTTFVVPPVIIAQATAGTITPHGALATVVSGPSFVTIPKSVAGSIFPSGAVARVVSGPSFVTIPKSLTSNVITPHGTVAGVKSGPSLVTIPKSVAGSITPHGALSTSVITPPPGGLRTMVGLWSLPDAQLGDQPTPDTIFSNANGAAWVNSGGIIDDLRASGANVVGKMYGNNSAVKNPDESYSQTKMFALIDAFIAGVRGVSGGETKMRNAVTDGYVRAFVLYDDFIADQTNPGDNSFLNGLSFEQLEAGAKRMYDQWPWMPTIARGNLNALRDIATQGSTVRKYVYLTAGQAQMRADNDGPISAYFGSQVTAGNLCALGVLGGLNKDHGSAGGDATPADVRNVGLAAMAHPKIVGFLLWKYLAGYTTTTAMQNALQDVYNASVGRTEGPINIKNIQPSPVYYTDTGVHAPTYPPPTVNAGSSIKDALTTHRIFKLLDNSTIQTAEYSPLNMDNSRIYYFNNSGAARVATLAWAGTTVQVTGSVDPYSGGVAGEILSAIWDRLDNRFFYFAGAAAPSAIYRRNTATAATTTMKTFSTDPSFMARWGSQATTLKLSGLHSSRNQEVLCGVLLNTSSVGVGAVAWGKDNSKVWNYGAPSGKQISRVNVDDQGTFMKANFTDGTWQVGTLNADQTITLSAVLTTADPPVRDDGRPSEFWQVSGAGVKRWTPPSQAAGTVVYANPQKQSKTDVYSTGRASLLSADDLIYGTLLYGDNPSQGWSLHNGSTYKINWAAELAGNTNKLAPQEVRANGVRLSSQSGFTTGASGGGTLTGFHVKTTGTSSGTGTDANPWSMAFAAAGAGGAIVPGSTVWVHDGNYVGNFTIGFSGTSANPVIFRGEPYPARPRVDGNITVTGANVYWWGMEDYHSNPNTNVNIILNLFGDGVKAINNIVHDSPMSGIGFWHDVNGGELYGNISYNNGTHDNLDHGVYFNNTDAAIKFLRDNIIFNNWAYGLHGYSSTAGELVNISMDGNIPFGGTGIGAFVSSDLLIGGSSVQNLTVQNHSSFKPDGYRSHDIGYASGSGANGTLTYSGNYLVGSPAAILSRWNTVNRPVASTEIEYASRPTSGTVIRIRPNVYEPGRGHVSIYNWGLAASVAVDLSTVLSVGAQYVIHHVFNLFGSPVVSGTYAGGTVSIPMTAVAPPTPIGRAFKRTPSAVGPAFGAFLVRPLQTSGSNNQLLAGQYYYDAGAGVLYVRLPDSSNPASAAMSVFDWRFGMEEIIMVQANGTLKGRLCHHYGHAHNALPNAFKGGGVSYDSSRVVFASNWGGGTQLGIYAALTNPSL